LKRKQEVEKQVVWEPIPDSSQELALDTRCHHTLYHGTRGPGKLQPLDEPVLTPMGWKPIGSLKRGSKVLTPKGHAALVTHVYPHKNRAIYKLTFDDGSSCRAGDEHLWKFKVTGYRRKALDENWQYDDTNAMIRFLEKGQAVLIPTINPAKIKRQPRLKELPIDPYLLGTWLGDGNASCTKRGVLTQVGITTADKETVDFISKFGFKHADRYGYSLRKRDDVTNMWGSLVRLKLQRTKAHSKFVPDMYLKCDVETRLAVLQGLMDTDGTCDPKGYCSFSSISKKLAENVQYLAWSLGAKSTLTGPHKSFCNGEQKQDHYDVYIQPAGKFVPFRLGELFQLNMLVTWTHAAFK
jgi:ATP-dependent DNA helicase RecG